ncbi:hypothetical protein [Amycolatopsis sp. NPDC059657]|uniref:hypothetical protein n=1 Tax=Amycolatopsis sp. NPDC059657 TaxID=3346899 RepID=UPI00366F4234
MMNDVFGLSNSVSDPASPEYNPRSPLYVVTADSSSKYYVGPVAPVTVSAEQLREQIATQMSAEGGWLNQFLSGLVNESELDARLRAHLERDADGLAHDLPPRQHGTAPQTAWESTSHEHMDAVVKTTAEPDAVAQSAQGWTEASPELAGHQGRLASAISTSLEGWRGSGGDAARAQIAQIAQWFSTSSRGAALAGRQQDVHAQVLGETKQQMAANPPVQFSAQEANARLQTITDPVEYGRQFQADMDAYNRQKAAQEQAARYMTQFDQTLGGSSTTSVFPTPPPAAESSVGGTSGPQPGTGGGRKGSVPSGGGQRVPTGGERAPNPIGGAPGAGPSGSQSGAQVPAAGEDGTHSAATIDLPHTPITPTPVPPSGPGPVAGQPGPNTGTGPWIGGPGTGTGSGSRVGTPGGFGGKTGGAPKMPGGEGLPGGRSSGSTPRVAGIGEPVARTGPGSPGGKGSMSPGAPMGGRGRGGKEEDEEHTRPAYLIDHETPQIFESDEKTTPPTIGVWKKTDRPES